MPTLDQSTPARLRPGGVTAESRARLRAHELAANSGARLRLAAARKSGEAGLALACATIDMVLAREIHPTSWVVEEMIMLLEEDRPVTTGRSTDCSRLSAGLRPTSTSSTATPTRTNLRRAAARGLSATSRPGGPGVLTVTPSDGRRTGVALMQTAIDQNDPRSTAAAAILAAGELARDVRETLPVLLGQRTCGGLRVIADRMDVTFSSASPSARSRVFSMSAKLLSR